jgi:hypothetical protein
VFLNCLTCFGRHTAHYHELRTLIVASGFTYVLAAAAGNPKTYVKPEAAITVLELLMMDGVFPETCWAIKKHWNNKFYYTVASCWFFLWDLCYDALIHKYQRWTKSKQITLVILEMFTDTKYLYRGYYIYSVTFFALSLWYYLSIEKC